MFPHLRHKISTSTRPHPLGMILVLKDFLRQTKNHETFTLLQGSLMMLGCYQFWRMNHFQRDGHGSPVILVFGKLWDCHCCNLLVQKFHLLVEQKNWLNRAAHLHCIQEIPSNHFSTRKYVIISKKTYLLKKICSHLDMSQDMHNIHQSQTTIEIWKCVFLLLAIL